MGHYLSEMGGGETVRQREYRLRKEKLEKTLDKASLGAFTVDELQAVMRFKGLARNSAGEECLREKDFEILERAAKRLNSPKRYHKSKPATLRGRIMLGFKKNA